MASTLIPFLLNPATAPPFQTVVTLDGASYSLYALYNFYAKRWYVRLYDAGGNLVSNYPLIGSPPGGSIPLFPGLFSTSTIIFQTSNNNFVITS